MLLFTNINDALIHGIGFLMRDPNSFECLDDKDHQWKPCSKQEICDKGIDKDHYRPVKDDEYLDNWERPEKFDTLCQSKYRVGLLGSFYFMGIVFTVLFIPLFSDKWFGRKKVLIVIFVFQLVAMLALILVTSLDSAYVWMFIIGACFPGRIFLALTYSIEFTSVKYQKMITFGFMLSEPFFLIMLTVWY